MRSNALLKAALPLLALLMLFALMPGEHARSAGPAPKKTFDIVVSTEWQPGSDDNLRVDLAAAGCTIEGGETFLADLADGMRSFASFFYRATGGQMAIGKVTIYTGGEQWDSANIRVLANRSYRPSAFVGGATPAPTAYYSRTASLEPAALFYPAPVLLSRQWNGRGARCGPWSAPEGWRTIAHEWAHHALYLYDEYMQQSSGAPQFCDADAPGFRLLGRGERAPAATDGTTPSLMGYHYTADQFSLWSGAAPPRCRGMPQTHVYDESDWATIARQYAAEGVVAPERLAVGPADAPPTTVTIVAPAAAPARTTAKATLGALPGEKLVGTAYLIRPNPTGDGTPSRIIGQGNMLPGEATPMLFWGVQPESKDRAAIIVQQPASGERFSFPRDYREAPPLSVAAPNTLAAAPSVWRPSLSIVPVVRQNPGEQTSIVSGLRVTLKDCTAQQQAPLEFVYCPAGGACGNPASVPQSPDGSFSYTFFFASGTEPALHGYIYARDPARGAETVTWYQLGGGVGPAHLPGHAPVAEGELNVDMAQNDPRSPTNDNRVLYSPTFACTAAKPLPPGVLGLASIPYNVQVAVAGPNLSQPWAGGEPPLRVRLNYDQDLLDRLGIDERQLVVLRLKGGFWQIVPTAGQSSVLDWISAQPQTFAPEGETYALGYGPAHVFLPLVGR